MTAKEVDREGIGKRTGQSDSGQPIDQKSTPLKEKVEEPVLAGEKW